MKTLIALLVTIPFFLSANTQLEDTMKSMGKSFKVLGKQVSDASKNQESLALAADMVVKVRQARDIMPDSIASLQEPERTKAFNDYQSILDSLLSQFEKLTAALNANDNATAAQVVQQMNETKKSGHDKYKKDN